VRAWCCDQAHTHRARASPHCVLAAISIVVPVYVPHIRTSHAQFDDSPLMKLLVHYFEIQLTHISFLHPLFLHEFILCFCDRILHALLHAYGIYGLKFKLIYFLKILQHVTTDTDFHVITLFKVDNPICRQELRRP
jgi:hypothetical protein